MFLTVDRVGLLSLVKTSVEENSPLQQGTPFPEPIQVSDSSNITPIRVDELKRKSSLHRTEAACCRERLAQIRNLTYVAEGWESAAVLKQVKLKLDECYKLLNDASPKENGLVLEVPERKEASAKDKCPSSQPTTSFKPIPQPIKKNPTSSNFKATLHLQFKGS